MLFNLRHLQCALEIQDTGTISEAAKRVHLSQSAITQGINKLENELGILLFRRSSAGMFVTNNGAHFLHRVARAFIQIRNIAISLYQYDQLKKYSFLRSITSRQLTALVFVCESHSYTAAAARLGLSQPTLHRSIKELETLCGLKLFTRSPSGVEPSWRARQISRYASLFFEELNQGIDEIGELTGFTSGRLRVGSLPLALSNIVPQCVLQLLAEYPETKISIIEGPYEEQLQAILHGHIDLIVGALRFPLPHNDIVQTKLFDDELSVVVKANHYLTHKSQLDNTDLQNIKWVVPSDGAPARKVFDNVFKQRGLPLPNSVIECSALSAVRSLLLNSDRAALLPAKQVQLEVTTGILAICPLTLGDTNRQIGITTRSNWQATITQQRFINILKAQYLTDK